MNMHDKVVVVTGSTSGIGKAATEKFLKLGAKVLGIGSSVRASGSGDRFHEIRIDLASAGAAEAVFEECDRRFGTVDVLVNNAGIGNASSILDTSDDDLERYLLINLKAPFALCREALQRMVPRGSGVIVNVSSVYGLIGAASSSAYSASKAGLIGLTRNLAAEFGRDGIRANAVAPGTTATPINADRLINARWMYGMWMDTTPLGRPGNPAEVAIAFLASDESSYINGVVLPVDGGWSSTKVVPKPRGRAE